MNEFHEPILVASPHLMLPGRNGADISVERVARYLSNHAPFVDLVGCQNVWRYRNAGLESESAYTNKMRGKEYAAIRTLLFRTHYYHERFNTPDFSSAVNAQMSKVKYGVILASYLTTLPLLPPASVGQRRFVWTHNDEFKWFEDLGRSARNPLSKMVSNRSLEWLEREVPNLAEQAVFLHTSERDHMGFERIVPGHRWLPVSIGTDLDPPESNNHDSKPDEVTLSFVGSLALRMAADALTHFHQQFEPRLREAFGDKLVVQVVGSNPLPVVRNLCRARRWQLYANVSDAELSQKLARTTFTILPFSYATGVKLKLVRSLGSGVPFLSTLAAQAPNFTAPAGCCYSDDPNDWVAAVRAWRNLPDRRAARQELRTFAEGFSWPVVVSRIADSIRQLPHQP